MSAPSATAPTTTSNCRFCWMCRHVCPVGHVTHRETLTPHAWALTIESVRRGQLSWNAETADVMYACADCGLCRDHCVTDQALPDAIVRARSEITAAGFAPAAVHELDRRLKASSSAYADAKPKASAGASRIALFVGDAGAHVGGSGAEAARALLAASGIEATPIGVGRSTGLLANTLGLASTATRLARDLIAEIDAAGVDELFVLSPADRWTFAHVYPVRLGVEWPVHVRVRTVATALAEALVAGRWRLRQGDAGFPAYAYHDACNGLRSPEEFAAPRALLAAALGAAGARQLFWREGRAHPCGAVGGLELTHPAVASALADSRFADAAAAGARCLVADDPVCVYHLSARRPAGIDVRNLYELLAAQCA